MSFRLGRGTPEKSKEKKSSGDELSDTENSIKSEVEQVAANSTEITTFELSNVRFEKVSESYIKHDKIREETIEDSTPSPVQIADMHDIAKHIENQIRKQSVKKANSLVQSVEADVHASNEDDQNDQPQFDMKPEKRASVDSIEAEGITINGNLSKQFEETILLNDENVNKLKTTLELVVVKPEPIYPAANNDAKNVKQRAELQCPTFEIMPPSRRSSFDPPRSPYLESLRSSCDTNSELMNRNRLDSVGDSFEMIETDRNQSR